MKCAKSYPVDLFKASDIEGIYSNCEKKGGCLLWAGRTSKPRGRGYGRIGLYGNGWSVHRVIWTFEYGSIPDGVIIRHSCDNSLCCNPLHMESGSQQDNMDDMVSRGRTVSKLAESDILFIRKNHKKFDPVMGTAPLAKKYGVAPTSISRIIHKKRWSHI